MKSSTDAIILPAKCGKTRQDFFVLFYKAYDGTWVETYGRESMPDSRGEGGGPVTVQLGNYRIGPQYKCPHCGERYRFRCWNCGKWTCFDGDTHEGRRTVCTHCGESGVFSSKPSSGSGAGASGGTPRSNSTTGFTGVGQ